MKRPRTGRGLGARNSLLRVIRAAPRWAPRFKCGNCRSGTVQARYPDRWPGIPFLPPCCISSGGPCSPDFNVALRGSASIAGRTTPMNSDVRAFPVRRNNYDPDPEFTHYTGQDVDYAARDELPGLRAI